MTDHPAFPLPERGSCTGCGACASICPQGIDVPGVLRTFAQRLAADERA